MRNIIKNFKISLKEVGIPVVIIGFALLFANYIYTFSGFVAYTESERRGCQLTEYILKTQINSEERKDRLEKLSEENKEVVARYMNQYLSGPHRCKTIQQFYIEESFIAVLLILLPFYYLTRRKN